MAKSEAITDLTHGDKLYHKRARRAFPLLVRQAEAGNPITYSDLAEEIDIPFPLNLNYVLGLIGRVLEELSKQRKKKIPPLQCVVIRKQTGLPGEGIGWFLKKTNRKEFGDLSKPRQRKIVQAELQRVYLFDAGEIYLKRFHSNVYRETFLTYSRRPKPLAVGVKAMHTKSSRNMWRRTLLR